MLSLQITSFFETKSTTSNVWTSESADSTGWSPLSYVLLALRISVFILMMVFTAQLIRLRGANSSRLSIWPTPSNLNFTHDFASNCRKQEEAHKQKREYKQRIWRVTKMLIKPLFKMVACFVFQVRYVKDNDGGSVNYENVEIRWFPSTLHSSLTTTSVLTWTDLIPHWKTEHVNRK